MKKLLVLTLMLAGFVMHGYPVYDRYSFSHITADHGLSNNQVEGICQDKFGRMWFATNDGINCYNGYDLTVFKHDPDDCNTIQSNIVNSLYVDRSGNIWACTANGLSVYDFDKAVFRRIQLFDDVSPVESIVQIAADIYLVGSRNVTLFYDISDGTSRICKVDGEDFRFFSISEHQGTLVAGTIHGKELVSLRYENGELVTVRPSVVMPHNISAILKADNGSYWVGLLKGGLYLVDLKKGTMSRPGEFIPDTQSVETLCYDKQGRLWIGTFSGLYVMDPTSRSFTVFNDDDNHVSSLSHNAIKSISCDKQGGMWIGTEYGGVNYWNGMSEVFHSLDLADEGSKSHRIITAMSMAEDNKTLWIGARHGGLKRFTLGKGCTATYDVDNIRSVLSVGDHVYVGMSVNGWKIIDVAGGKTRTFNRPSDVNAFLKAPEGKIWVGSLSGLYLYDPHTGQASKKEVSDENKLFRILSLFRDSRGILWVGAKEGLKGFKVSDEFELTEVPTPVSDDIVHVQSLYESRDSILWIGTADGLFKYDPQNGSLTLLKNVPGLCRVTVKGIEEDLAGNLWVSTDNGLTRYNPVTGDNRTYYVGDGLPSNQFNAYSSHCHDSFGNLYFGSVGGVVMFNPETAVDNENTHRPILTGLRLFNVDVIAGDSTGILEKDLSLTESIELAHCQNSFTLSFACPDYASEGRNRFRYMLEGVDEQWIEAKGRSVTYSNLDKGDYCFVLAVANSDGIWCEDTARLNIRVCPVWYRTLLAEILFILIALLAAGYAIYRMKKFMDNRNAEKIGLIERKYEEDIRRARIASYVSGPYLLKPADEAFLEQVFNYIDSNLVNQQFSVEMLASMLGMTRANLHLKVKTMTGSSPVELIRRIRVEAACRLIREGRMSLTDIGEQVGFNSTSYFTVAFKKVLGCTPSEYAATLAQKKDI